MAPSHSSWATSVHEQLLPCAATRRGPARRPGHLVVKTDVAYRTVDFPDAERMTTITGPPPCRQLASGCARNRCELSHPVSLRPRGCQPAGVPGPAQHIRCQSGVVAPRWGALPRALAPSSLRRVAGRVRLGRGPVSGYVVADIAGGLRESGADAGDPAKSSSHKPPRSQPIPGQG
jgi:hypothetical protein